MNPTPLPSVVAATPADGPAAHGWARRLGVATLELSAWRGGAGGSVVLWCDADGLALRGPAASRAAPVRPEVPNRPRAGHDPLLRAVPPGSVIDATAGLAGDAGTLAAAGRSVTMIERHPALIAVLDDALARWRDAGVAAAEQLRLQGGDARALLADLRADVVLLDPMYPTARGAARKGEGLHLLRALVGGDDDQGALLGAARRAARLRVVVKRPLGAPHLADIPPSGALRGRTVRFDLYPPQEATP